ncbi:MAG: hypothetical protein JWR60_514 [Polaromonas sp.]|nr:hypothetical protein [Polaromonas sp.]
MERGSHFHSLGDSMRLQRIGFTVDQLRGIPSEERSLIIVLAHALNEVNTLNKILFFCTRYDQEPLWVAQAQAAQAFILARPLVGKLSESWSVLQKGYFQTKLSKAYAGLLEPAATESLDYLKSYFGPKNLINEVRNNFAFHYSLEHAKTSIPDDSSLEDLATYVHQTHGNSLYYFAEYLMNKALIDLISPADPELALGTLLDEMSKVIAHLNEFVQGLLFVVLDKYIGKEVIRQSVHAVELGAVPQSLDIRIPFFFELSAPLNDLAT